MKKIPSLNEIPLRYTLFADGDEGMAKQHLRNDEYDITVVRERPHGKAPFSTQITIGGINGVFKNVADADKAVLQAGRSKSTPSR